jgi:putative hemolysin
VDLLLWLELGLFIVLMGLSGFFSSSETSLFSLNSIDLEQMRRDENPRADLIERLLSEPRRLIVTILIGNEFVNVAASVISAAIVIRVLGAENKFINLFIMVPILLLVGEITPKTLAIRHNVAFASFQSRLINVFAAFITPVRWLVRLVADWITTQIVGRERSRGNIITEDMVRTLAHEAVGDGVLDRAEAQYIDHIFDFGNDTLRDIMTPRSNIFFLPAAMPVSRMVAELRRTRHTKVPVYRDHRDEVVGVLYARDLLGMDVAQVDAEPERLAGLLREPYFVPESKPAADLFYALRQRRLSLALTVDEYGGVTGLVTMEDLLESIFGAIPSASEESREEEREVRRLDDACVRLAAALSVEDFNRDFDEALPDVGAETLGGFLLHQHGELPVVGTSILVGTLRFAVAAMEGNRIKEVTVCRVPVPEPMPERATEPGAEEVPTRAPEDTSEPPAAAQD